MNDLLYDAGLRAGLTHRQAQVLAAYVDAGSVKKAAAQLDMATSTLTGHLSRIQRRLGVSHTAGAVAKVLVN